MRAKLIIIWTILVLVTGYCYATWNKYSMFTIVGIVFTSSVITVITTILVKYQIMRR